MRNEILSNIINYVTEHNIHNVDDSDIFNLEYSMNELNDHLQWTDISKSLGFDKIGIYLLENFKNAIDNEDYISAKYMKEEISKHWNINEELIWEKGREYLYDLRIGCENTSFKYLLNDIKELEYIWINKKMEGIGTILPELEVIANDINHHSRNEVNGEVLDSIINSNYTHPVLLIDIIVTFFKLIKV